MPWSQFADLQNGQILELQLYMALPGNLDVGRRGCCVCKDAGFTVFIYPGFLQFPYWVLLLCRLGTSQLSGGHLRWNFYASYSSVLHPGSFCPLDPVLSQALTVWKPCGPAGWLQCSLLLEGTTRPTNQQLSNPHSYLGSSNFPSLCILPCTGQESGHIPFWELAYCFLSLGRWGRIWPNSLTEKISLQN